jgi:hypothetical protein
MPQFIVLILPPGEQPPPEGHIATARFVLTTQADANTAATLAQGVFKPSAGDKLWTTPTANLQPNVATITYGIA